MAGVEITTISKAGPVAQIGQNFDPNNPAASFGPPPVMETGGGSSMTFREIGTAGLRQFSGWVREEFLQDLVGRQGAQKYREMMDNSPIVGAIMYAVISAMRKVEWRVVPPNDSPDAKEKGEFVEGMMEDMSHTWEEFVVDSLSMLGYGYAPHELCYKKRLGPKPPKDPQDPYGRTYPRSDFDDGLIGWRKIPVRGQDTVLKWFFDNSGDVLGMTQQPWTGPIVDIPMEKMLLFRPSVHKNNPEGRSILRSAYLPYYYTKRMQEQEAIVGERMGGIPVLYLPGQLFSQAKAGNASALATVEYYKKMITNVRVDEQMGLLLPSDVYPGATGPSTVRQYEFELVTPQGRPMGGFSFDAVIARYNTTMLTSVLADFILMGHNVRGAQNLGETKVDMFFQAIEGFLNGNASVINRHALPRLWDLNGFELDDMPQIEPDLAQRVDLDVLSNFVLRMSQAGMPLFPNEDLQTYILDAAGLPDMVDDDALRAAGLADDQLDLVDEKAQTAFDAQLAQTQQQQAAAKAPPTAPGGPMEKMILASLARRFIKMNGAVGNSKVRKRRRPHKHTHR